MWDQRANDETDRAREFQTANAGRHSDGDGLLLVVKETGRKTWVLRYQVNGVRRDKGLGSYPEVSLKEARSKAGADRALIAKGLDPIDHRAGGQKGLEACADLRRHRANRHSRCAEQVDQCQSAISTGAPSRRGLFRSLIGASGARDHDGGGGRGPEASLAHEA